MRLDVDGIWKDIEHYKSRGLYQDRSILDKRRFGNSRTRQLEKNINCSSEAGPRTVAGPNVRFIEKDDNHFGKLTERQSRSCAS
jgi:hypothetical protein